MPFPARSYVGYVDDSGNETVGLIWTALLIPLDLWTEYLRRWLSFRHWLYRQHGVPASFELHAQVWLSVEPAKQTPPEQLLLVTNAGDVVDVLHKGRDRRRARFEIFEKGLRTIGTFAEALLFTTFSSRTSGQAKLELYDDLLCFVEATLAVDRTHASIVVDGRMDGGDHLRAAHRALAINRRRVIEDPTMRSSAESQLLQMADWCAYSAFQSIQNKDGFDPKFRRAYEMSLSRIIVRPFGVDEGRCIRGCDYEADRSDCPSERVG